MARKYDVEGTKTYLIMAIILLALGVWHLIDGWFPRPSILKVHPQEIILKASSPSTVIEVSTEAGEEVTIVTKLLTLKETDANRDKQVITLKNGLSEKAKVKHGVVEKVLVTKGDIIVAKQPLVQLRAVRDSYYLYNKTTAVIMIIASFVCAYIHKAVR